MGASRPAARPTLPLTKAFTTPIDPLQPGLGLFRGLDPANPFVAGEGGDVLPSGHGLRITFEGVPQILGQIMNDAARDCLCVRQRESLF